MIIKILEQLSWKPTKKLEQICEIMLDFELGKNKKPNPADYYLFQELVKQHYEIQSNYKS